MVGVSVFSLALGEEFERLHPELRRRFGFGAGDGVACVGTGVMHRIWRARRVAPLLRLGARRNILFPEEGTDVPFMIENYAYRDRFGRDTLTFVRTFELARRRRRFDATMVHDPVRGGVVDYLGTHQHLAVDLDLRVDERGGMRITSGGQRFRAGWVDARLPLTLSGEARLHEWYDERLGRFEIEVAVSNRVVGPVFGYRGWFRVEYVDGPVPACAKPLREVARS